MLCMHMGVSLVVSLPQRSCENSLIYVDSRSYLGRNAKASETNTTSHGFDYGYRSSYCTIAIHRFDAFCCGYRCCTDVTFAESRIDLSSVGVQFKIQEVSIADFSVDRTGNRDVTLGLFVLILLIYCGKPKWSKAHSPLF